MDQAPFDSLSLNLLEELSHKFWTLLFKAINSYIFEKCIALSHFNIKLKIKNVKLNPYYSKGEATEFNHMWFA